MHRILATLCLICGCHGSSLTSEPPVPEQPEVTTPEAALTPIQVIQQTPVPVRPQVEDLGVFSELDDRVVLKRPTWLSDTDSLVIETPSGDRYLMVAGRAVAMAATEGEALKVKNLVGADADSDGIPDTIDLLIGAKKTVLNGAAYGSPYREIAYPGGDVPREEGVCTDTIVRALRNAGIDLQDALQKDIRRSPRSYPMVDEANANIDHRRVKTLLPYFKRHWQELPVEHTDKSNPWLPGDVLFMNTMGDKRPDHVGIITDTLGPSGLPLIINNYTNGYSTAAMDILESAPNTHRFRLPGGLRLAASDAGLSGVLNRHRLTLSGEHKQVILVTTPTWRATAGELRRFERKDSAWTQVGKPVAVRVGEAGLGHGIGVAASSHLGPIKREGDGKSPAGVYKLGPAFGTAARLSKATWPYEQVKPGDVWVDDELSPAYNTRRRGPVDWRSAEDLTMYPLAVEVRHNADPIQAGKGSAIFLHTTLGEGPTLGCTSMSKKNLLGVARWLEPKDSPLLIQVVGHVFLAQ